MPTGSYEKRRSWPAWQGDAEQFQRLAAALKQVEQERLEKRLTSSEDAIESEVFMSVRERIDNYGGPLDAIIKQFDRRTALGVTFRVKVGIEDSIELDLAGREFFPEVELHVRSTDLDFTRTTYARLSDEIDKGIPWWGKVSPILRNILALTTATTLLVATVSLIAYRSKEFHLSDLGRVAFAASFSAALATFGGMVTGIARRGPMEWFFPQFEVTGDGVSSATRRVTTIVLLVLSIPIGILVNVISP
ncbi:hypothetical protein AB0C22_02545 [Micromonospora sp. NPDC048894]|uniref:hypothetical protein n=1 Tax=unclassified Micromonospora TaxID=2617518 RepID=UPI0033C7B325